MCRRLCIGRPVLSGWGLRRIVALDTRIKPEHDEFELIAAICDGAIREGE